MTGKRSFLNLRLLALLTLGCFFLGTIAFESFGQQQPPTKSQPAEQKERPRRVPDNTPQSDPAKPDPAPKDQSQNPKPAEKPAEPTQQSSDSQSQQKPKDPQDPRKPGKQPDPEPETIRIDSRLVTVPVSVTDANGNPIRNLTAEDFVVEEDGVTQQVQTLGEPGKTPIEMVLLFDVSRSIRNRFDFEREAASRFVNQVLKPGDGISIFTIGTIPKLAVPRTDNVEKAVSGAMSIQPTEDSTAFHDTVVKAAQHISDSSNPEVRRVMVVLSDGEDTNSVRFKLGDSLRELQRAECLFYSINPSGPSIFLNRISIKGQDGMFKLATDTGGMAFLPDKLEDLTQVFNQITAELQAQYLLGYYSTNETNDGKFRRIKVKAAKNHELRIRARSGYFAPKD